MRAPRYACAMRRIHSPRRVDLQTRTIVLIRTTREALGWSQRELARRANRSPSMICRLESERLPNVTLRTISQLLNVLEVRVDLDVQPPLIVDPPSQRDAAHARCSSSVRRRLEVLGWIVALEVEVISRSARGWIDVLAYHPLARSLLVIEIKTEIRDVGAIQRSITWYEREAFDVARRMGWHAVRVASALFLLETVANDAAVIDNRELLRQSFPTRAPALASWLQHPEGRPPPRGMAMIDPISHRRAWPRPTRADGRRSPAPHLNYADFMRHGRRRRH